MTSPSTSVRRKPGTQRQSSTESEPAGETECNGQLVFRSNIQIVFAAHSTHCCAHAGRQLNTTRHVTMTRSEACRDVGCIPPSLYRVDTTRSHLPCLRTMFIHNIRLIKFAYRHLYVESPLMAR